jgi:hypothetical protein
MNNILLTTKFVIANSKSVKIDMAKFKSSDTGLIISHFVARPEWPTLFLSNIR